MKNLYLLIILGVLFTACSGGDGEEDDNPTPPKENKAPSAVSSLTFPTNNLLCISNILEFSWVASVAPDGDSVSYLLEISKNNQFSPIDQSVTVNRTFQAVTLEKGFAYYWRVKAIDSKNLSADYSSVYQFYTEGEGVTNHLPFAPELIAPELNVTVSGTSINLEWDCSDVDDDPLTYDVYFGTETAPTTKVGDNQSAKSLSVSVNPSNNYYWQIIAKDGQGGESIGQIWSFSTN